MKICKTTINENITCIHHDEIVYVDINHIIPKNVSIHISFDVDVLDKSIVSMDWILLNTILF